MPTHAIYAAHSTGAGTTGLTPTWVGFYDVTTGASISSAPSITEIGSGWYKFTTDQTRNVCGQIDLGATADAGYRYLWAVISGSNATIFPVFSDRGLTVS